MVNPIHNGCISVTSDPVRPCSLFSGRGLRPEPDYDRVLVRIMHLFEEGEDPEFSKPVSIDLKVFMWKAFTHKYIKTQYYTWH